MNEKITAIVAAYNEEPRISAVLKVLQKSEIVDEVIVIDDGSIDDTSGEARKFSKAKVIRHKKNLGKGAALETGIKNAGKADILLFLDADLIGLTDYHLKNLVDPILENEAEMTIGYLGKNIKKATNLASRMIKGISGQRALTQGLSQELLEIRKAANLGGKIWSRFSGLRGLKQEMAPKMDLKNSGFGVDLLITKYVKKKGGEIRMIELKDLTQVTKEEKRGFPDGLNHRIKMYKEILHGQKKNSA